MGNGTSTADATTARCLAVSAKVVEVSFVNNAKEGGKNIIKRVRREKIKLFKKHPSSNAKNGVRRRLKSKWGDKYREYKKPEWVANRKRNHNPVLYYKEQKIRLKVKVRIELDCSDKSKTLTLKSIRGRDHLGKKSNRFPGKKPTELTFSSSSPSEQTIKPGVTEVTFETVQGKESLPNCIAQLSLYIHWYVKFAEKKVPVKAGMSGRHRVYVTLQAPHGKMEFVDTKSGEDYDPTKHSFQQQGDTQIVTEPRLRYSVRGAQYTGDGDEQDVVDKIFDKFARYKVWYALGYRWNNSQTTTFVEPKITLHHYLWLCALGWDKGAKGECHNIAASFMLACQILGVKDKFAIGYLYPRTNKDTVFDFHSGSFSSPSSTKKGVYSIGNAKAHRNHTDSANSIAHGWESITFGGGGGWNNFEGVASYRDQDVLYAIGDVILDRGDEDKNAILYFTERELYDPGLGVKKAYKVKKEYPHNGFAQLKWSAPWVQDPLTGNWSGGWTCPEPYPGVNKHFYWQDT